MLQVCWQWSQNVHQVKSIKNENSLPYVRCFVTMVTQQRRSPPQKTNGHGLSHFITMVTKHAAYSKLFWIWIVFTRRVFWDHCQQNWSIFIYLTPVEPKYLPLTFSSITKERYVVDRSKYTFSESVWQEESIGIVFDKIEWTFEFDPCTNYFATPGLL